MSRHLLHVEEPIHQLTALGAALFRPTARYSQDRPLVLDQASHLVGHFREDLRLEQELVQPLEILLHHDNASSGGQYFQDSGTFFCFNSFALVEVKGVAP